MFSALFAILTSLASPAKWLVKEVSGYLTRRDAIKEAKLQAELARITAEQELAAYKVKADLEWDLAWAGQAQSSWKDEYVLAIWSVPLLVAMPALVHKPWMDHILATIDTLQKIDPNILTWYMTGWGIIFSATFGMKAAGQLMLPGKVKEIAAAFAPIPDDIPEDAVKLAAEKVKQLVAQGKKPLL